MPLDNAQLTSPRTCKHVKISYTDLYAQIIPIVLILS